MCASQQPLNGADSARPWNVVIVDRHDPDARPRKLTLTAFGRKDVDHQVDEMGEYLVLRAEAA